MLVKYTPEEATLFKQLVEEQTPKGWIGKWELDLVTPRIADEFLARNKNPRMKSNPKHVNYLAERILRGEWRPALSILHMDRDGYFFNLWHRMLAVKKANRPILTWVLHDLDPEIAKLIDWSALIRTLADILPPDVVNRKMIAYCTGTMLHISEGWPRGRRSPNELLEFFFRYRKSIEWAVRTFAVKRRTFPAAVTAAFAYVHAAKKMNRKKLEVLAHELATSVGRTVENAISIAMESACELSNGSETQRAALSTQMLFAIRLYLRGKHVFDGALPISIESMDWARKLHGHKKAEGAMRSISATKAPIKSGGTSATVTIDGSVAVAVAQKEGKKNGASKTIDWC